MQTRRWSGANGCAPLLRPSADGFLLAGADAPICWLARTDSCWPVLHRRTAGANGFAAALNLEGCRLARTDSAVATSAATTGWRELASCSAVAAASCRLARTNSCWPARRGCRPRAACPDELGSAELADGSGLGVGERDSARFNSPARTRAPPRRPLRTSPSRVLDRLARAARSRQRACRRPFAAFSRSGANSPSLTSGRQRWRGSATAARWCGPSSPSLPNSSPSLRLGRVERGASSS